MFEKLRKLLKSDDGFTLVEILTAMGVFAVALLGIVQVFYYAMLMNASSKQIATSANLARQEMDTIRLMTIPELDKLVSNSGATVDIDINNDGQTDYNYFYTINKSNLSVGSGYLKYVVMIEFSPKGIAKGTRVGQNTTYKMRSVLLRNPDDQN